MKTNNVKVLRYGLKTLAFLGMLGAFCGISLKEAIEEYTRPGTTTLKSHQLVTSYVSPAFVFCFTPSFNESSKLRPDFFTQGESDQAWHYSVPLWDLFYQSSFVVGRDFDLIMSYHDLEFHDINDFILEEGVTDLGRNREVNTILLPTTNQGMCHGILPNFR